jgi:hypothetical protein
MIITDNDISAHGILPIDQIVPEKNKDISNRPFGCSGGCGWVQESYSIV